MRTLIVVLLCVAGLEAQTSSAAKGDPPERVIKMADFISISGPGFCLRFPARPGSDGEVTFPLIGPIKVVGLTPSQASKVINSKLEAFNVDPSAVVSVVDRDDPEINGDCLYFAPREYRGAGQVGSQTRVPAGSMNERFIRAGDLIEFVRFPVGCFFWPTPIDAAARSLSLSSVWLKSSA